MNAPNIDAARFRLVVALSDFQRRLFVIEDDGRDEISLNDVWALLRPFQEAIKELQAATITETTA